MPIAIDSHAPVGAARELPERRAACHAAVALFGSRSFERRYRRRIRGTCAAMTSEPDARLRFSVWRPARTELNLRVNAAIGVLSHLRWVAQVYAEVPDASVLIR